MTGRAPFDPRPARPAARLPQRAARRLAHRQAPGAQAPDCMAQVAARADARGHRRGLGLARRRSRCRRTQAGAGAAAAAADSPAAACTRVGAAGSDAMTLRRRHRHRRRRCGGGAAGRARRRRRLAQPARRARLDAAQHGDRRRDARARRARRLPRRAPATASAATPTRGGAPYAGGRAIETPFGTVYAPNLTPDAATGLGRWSRRRVLARPAQRPLARRPAALSGVPVSELHPRHARRCRRDVRLPAAACRRSRKPNTPHALRLSVRPRRPRSRSGARCTSARRAVERSGPHGRVEPRRLPGRRPRPLQRLPLGAQRARRDRAARSTSPAA